MKTAKESCCKSPGSRDVNKGGRVHRSTDMSVYNISLSGKVSAPITVGALLSNFAQLEEIKGQSAGWQVNKGGLKVMSARIKLH